MRIDEFLPRYDVAERHATVIAATPEAVYAAARRLDLSGSWIIRGLFLLRGLPALFARRRPREVGLGTSLDGLLRSGFVVLADEPSQELVLGLVGRFWTPTGGVVRLDAPAFANFATAGYAKAVWNFHLVPLAEGRVRLETETRVLCLDEASRRRFRLYWLLIGRFSGLTRILMLRQVRGAAEASISRAAAKQTASPGV